jgi:hypothetical protein
MNLPSAQAYVVTQLDSLLCLFESEQSGPGKSPCAALNRFKTDLASQTVPILFRNRLREIAQNLEGIAKSPGLSGPLAALIARANSEFRNAISELPVDMAQQIPIALSTDPGSTQEVVSIDLGGFSKQALVGRRLKQAIAETARAVVKEHMANRKLDDTKFSTMQRVANGPEFENYTDWQIACREFLESQRVSENAEVIVWIGGEVITTKWSEIVSQCEHLFDDNVVFPADFSWVAIFFHYDLLEFGKR